ncbi:MAG TPA: hypothetical protein VFK76_11315 [Gaiellaceae bacterium]|nr:hypothetical protein [Gaiellaceae bacterium]
MRVHLAALGLAGLVVFTGVTVSAPAAPRADDSVFGGLGTWVDIYDGPVFAAPLKTAARMAARHVTTVWIETSNDRAALDVMRPLQLGRLVEALHAKGIRVVAWYLPGHVDTTLDVRRSLAMLNFRTPAGQPFDGVALDIESTRLKNVGLRSRRAVALARLVRQEAGDTPLAIIPFNPRGLERRPKTWPRFPWADLAATSDAFAPMVYTSGLKGFDATYGYVTRAIRLLRVDTGNPDVPIHVIGGVADQMGPEELAGFAAAVADDGQTIGVSLYDWQTTSPAAWRVLDSVKE